LKLVGSPKTRSHEAAIRSALSMGANVRTLGRDSSGSTSTAAPRLDSLRTL
jgi:hypothetical protein